MYVKLLASRTCINVEDREEGYFIETCNHAALQWRHGVSSGLLS